MNQPTHIIPFHPEGTDHPIVRKFANRAARAAGWGKATEIVIDCRLRWKAKVIEARSYAYCKDSTGEEVPRAYVNKCMGKGVHYRRAYCKVAVPFTIPPTTNQTKS